VVIDQHAAAERVAFARLRTGYEKRRVASQRLLVPVALPIDAREAALVEQMHDEVASVGLEIRLLGPGAAVVTAVPQVVSSAAPERLARDLLDELSREGGRGFSARVDRVLATMACHGALRAGESVSAEQAAALLEALDGVEHGGHCPHGRPLVHEVRFSELEREVGRR
jgi:DNA mismatch repair protein MutL